MNTTCGDYEAALATADPGENPSAERTAQAQAAQDDIASGLMWVHGYLAGRAGPRARPPALTREWMADHAKRVMEACVAQSDDGAMRLTDVVARM